MTCMELLHGWELLGAGFSSATKFVLRKIAIFRFCDIYICTVLQKKIYEEVD